MLTVQGPDGKPVQIPQNAAMQSLQHAQFNTNNTNIRGGKYREPMNQQSPKENITGDNNTLPWARRLRRVAGGQGGRGSDLTKLTGQGDVEEDRGRHCVQSSQETHQQHTSRCTHCF